VKDKNRKIVVPEEKRKSSGYVLVVGTSNPGKIHEIRHVLRDLPIEIRTPDTFPPAPDIVEDAETLEGNATLKATAWYQRTGFPSVADDTGLEVDSLAGRPGVHSARFAGPLARDADNRKELLRQLDGVESRTARFRTVIAFVDEGGPLYFEGVCEGTILTKERGTGGFGYDALFVPEGHSRTFAELDTEEKNRISHRGKAMEKFSAFLHDRLDRTEPRITV
jgi:XTP/dITP diphosphohydrolase